MACNGVFTNLFRRKYANVHDVGADVFASLRVPPYPGYPASPGPPHAPYLQISHFKIGCAHLPWGSPTPPPDPDYIDLVAWGLGTAYCPVDLESDPGNPEGRPLGAVGIDFYACKLIAPAFISVVGSDLTVQCRLEGPEANDDGTGNPPHFYELGIFDQDDDMIVYVTFAEEVKTSTVAIQHNVTVTF